MRWQIRRVRTAYTLMREYGYSRRVSLKIALPWPPQREPSDGCI